MWEKIPELYIGLDDEGLDYGETVEHHERITAGTRRSADCRFVYSTMIIENVILFNCSINNYRIVDWF